MNSEIDRDFQKYQDMVGAIRHEMHNVIVGYDAVIDQMLIALLSRYHAILDGMPGLGKTLMVHALAMASGLSWKKVPFTPDMLAQELKWLTNQRTGERREGPLFTNLFLADELNRATPKTQSALLEAMEERHVTDDEGRPHSLPDPFVVYATMNPADQKGTFPLSEANLDRFALHIVVDYQSTEEELAVLRLNEQWEALDVSRIKAVSDAKRIKALSMWVAQNIELDNVVAQYIVDLVRSTRPRGYPPGSDMRKNVKHGASPRAGNMFARGGKASAFLQGRRHTTQQDIDALAFSVLEPRIKLSVSREIEQEDGRMDRGKQHVIEQVLAEAQKKAAQSIKKSIKK